MQLVGNKYNLTTNPLHLSHLAYTSQLPGRKINKEEAYKNIEGGGGDINTMFQQT